MTSTRQAPKGSGGTPCWHVHHDQLVGVLIEPLRNRVAYIKREKPLGERALRLRLIKPVRGKLPEAVVKARAAYDKARAACDKARAAYDTAWAAYVEAGAAYDTAWAAYARAGAAHNTALAAYIKAIKNSAPAFRALHAKECPNCPWDGKTIFHKVSA